MFLLFLPLNLPLPASRKSRLKGATVCDRMKLPSVPARRPSARARVGPVSCQTPGPHRCFFWVRCFSSPVKISAIARPTVSRNATKSGRLLIDLGRPSRRRSKLSSYLSLLSFRSASSFWKSSRARSGSRSRSVLMTLGLRYPLATAWRRYSTARSA